MRLRTQTTLMIGAALLCGLVIAAAAIEAITVAQRAAVAGQRAKEVLRHARSLLVLTHEMARYGNARVAQQWRARDRAIEEGVARALAEPLDGVHPPDVAASLAALPGMFDTLVATFDAPSDDALAQRRRELLLDLLVAEVQAVTEQIHDWDGRVEQRRAASEHRLALLTAIGPLLMALPLAGMGWVMTVRVLGPVGRLQRTMARVEAGDLSARIVSTRHDEIGDLKRAFTRMTGALQTSTAQLADNEQRLRLITDNLPARVSHYDREERCTFANRPFYETWGYSGPQQVVGRRTVELFPRAIYESVRPHTLAALAGQPQFFTVSVAAQGGHRHHEYAMLPDKDAGGQVHGVYVMARDVTERVEAENRIEAALREKEVLLKEVHHRVKNNLQIVSSLLQLQAGSQEGAAVRELLADSQDRIRSMALIHEKLYQHHDFARIDFADYLRGLLAVLSASHGTAARLDIDAESLWLDIDQAVPAGLIVNELVTNSWKHAFPGGREGCIRVRFAAEGERRLRLEVADDGIGLAPGADPEQSRSLGLRLVRLLAGQLEAELRFSGPPGFGCSLVFERTTTIEGEVHG
jgi:PAS domain S-box-containing protein